MAHPAIVRFGGNLVRTLGALTVVPGTMLIGSAATGIAAAITPFVLPAAAVAAAGVGAAMVIKRVSSRR